MYEFWKCGVNLAVAKLSALIKIVQRRYAIGILRLLHNKFLNYHK